MANPEHLKILKQGVEVWNEWKDSNLGLQYVTFREGVEQIEFFGYADFFNADLHNASLPEVNLSKADIQEANLSWANLTRADFYSADCRKTNFNRAHFYQTNFHEANLSESTFIDSYLYMTNFGVTNLKKVNFSNAKLNSVFFVGSDLNETDFSNSELSYTVFSSVDLSTCKGLETVKVKGSCIIDFHTFRISRNIPKSFLLKIGLPENYINYLPDFFDENPIRMYPVFLSHSWQNKDFANKLYEALIARGVQVWYDEKKMKPGDDIYESLSRGIEVYDKMILVCSKESLGSWWVDREIGRILEKERKLLKEKGKKVKLLIPIKIDDHIHDWDGGKKTEILDLKIGDFRHWQDEAKFQKALDELIAALNVDRGENAPPTFL